MRIVVVVTTARNSGSLKKEKVVLGGMDMRVPVADDDSKIAW